MLLFCQCIECFVSLTINVNKYDLQVCCLINTLRTGAFKLFKCTFPGSKEFKSTFILCFFKYL